MKIQRLMMVGCVAMLFVAALTYSEFVAEKCVARGGKVRLGAEVEYYTCGSDECPPNAKTTAHVFTPAELPLEGWYAYIDGGKIYTSDLKEFAPQEVPNTDGASGGRRLMITDDGNWLLYTDTDNKSHLIKKNGQGKKFITEQDGAVTWYRSSPFGGEVAYTAGSQVKAIKVTFSDNSVTVGTERTLTSNSRIQKTPWFEAAGSHFVGQGGKITDKSLIWGTEQGFYYPAPMYEIPDDGKGVASSSYYVNPYNPWVCGITLSPDGSLMAGNFEHGYQDCVPWNHKGFCVVPTDNYDYGGHPENWIFRENTSTNFCPPEYDGVNLFDGAPPSNDFQHYNWTNHEDWITSVRESYKPVHGAWIIDWRKNVWCLLTPKNTPARKAAAYLTKVDPTIISTSVAKQPKHTLNRMNRMDYLQSWHDVLGRNVRSAVVPGSKNTRKDLPAGVYFNKNMKKMVE
jgi:hypothetical protein